MPEYEAPLEDILFNLDAFSDIENIVKLPGYEDYDRELIESVVTEAAKVARNVVAPLNVVGDRIGAQIENGNVTMPHGWFDAFQAVAQGGWIGLSETPEHGGQGFPFTVAAAVSEMWLGANAAFSLCNVLTQGAISAIELSGSEDQKAAYMPSLIDGTWTGTMNLTEPQAGSNLAAIRTMATPNDDHYLIAGQKIFISYGDHSLTSNIIHLVLARTPDAPKGVKGLSLFVVPKFSIEDGVRNDITTVSLEHKMGIHASPTAVLSFGDNGGAKGYLLGERNRGIEYMFTMMNAARFEVGISGMAVAEAAYQAAKTYAEERLQGAAIGAETEGPINTHPDVMRMLLNMKSNVAAMRAIAYFGANARDRSLKLSTGNEQAAAEADYSYLIPIVKGWITETCQQVTYDAVQVHGGWGFIEETGVAQYARDGRISTLYEGTTGIQATDLTFRKTVRDQAQSARRMLAHVRELADDAGDLAGLLNETSQAAEDYLEWLLSSAPTAPRNAAATADTYLHGIGSLLGAALLIKGAALAEKQRPDTDFALSRAAVANHFAQTALPKARTMFETAAKASEQLTNFKANWL